MLTPAIKAMSAKKVEMRFAHLKVVTEKRGGVTFR
jgi:hypothetical protein